MLAANAHLAPAYRTGIVGVARSMPTSGAVDRVAQALGVPCYETPTGWKFFGNLLDAGRVTLCGEESAGTGSTTCARRTASGPRCCGSTSSPRGARACRPSRSAHWARFGRNYYTRHDFEGLDSARRTR